MIEQRKFTPAEIAEEARKAAQKCHEENVIIYGVEVSEMIQQLDTDEQLVFAGTFLNEIRILRPEPRRKR